MDNYEIRIVKDGESGPFLYNVPLVNDYAAVRRAQSLMPDGGQVEVWRGQDCIYSSLRG